MPVPPIWILSADSDSANRIVQHACNDSRDMVTKVITQTLKGSYFPDLDFISLSEFTVVYSDLNYLDVICASIKAY